MNNGEFCLQEAFDVIDEILEGRLTILYHLDVGGEEVSERRRLKVKYLIKTKLLDNVLGNIGAHPARLMIII